MVQLCKDYEDYAEVNRQLDKMYTLVDAYECVLYLGLFRGYNIGVRLIEDFLARSNLLRCQDFRDTAEVVSKVGFKMFLNVTPTVTNWSADGKECSLILDENPLAEMVELPLAPSDPSGFRPANELWYSNILCGVVRGALEMVQMQVHVSFVGDVLRGDALTEMRLKFVRMLDEQGPPADD